MIEHALDCDQHDFTQCPDFKRLVENLAAGGRLHAGRGFRRPRPDGTRRPTQASG